MGNMVIVVLLMLACLSSGVTGHTTMCRSCTNAVRGPAECMQLSHCQETCITEVHHRTSGQYVFKYRCGDSQECKDFEQGHVHGRIVCRECCGHTGCDKRTCSNYFSTAINKSTIYIPTTTTVTTKPLITTTTTTTKVPTTIKVPTTRVQTTTLDASATTKPYHFKTSAYAPFTLAPTSTTKMTSMTTTTLASAKQYTSSSIAQTKSFVAKRCDSLGVLSDMVKGSSASNPGTPICPDGTHQTSEALVQKYCGAPNVTSWISGRKVMDNCQSVPTYTPIAASTASFGGSVVAGVFVRCEVNGFQAAIQTCGSQLKLYYVSTSSTPDVPSADKFVLLDW